MSPPCLDFQRRKYFVLFLFQRWLVFRLDGGLLLDHGTSGLRYYVHAGLGCTNCFSFKLLTRLRYKKKSLPYFIPSFASLAVPH